MSTVPNILLSWQLTSSTHEFKLDDKTSEFRVDSASVLDSKPKPAPACIGRGRQDSLLQTDKLQSCRFLFEHRCQHCKQLVESHTSREECPR
jgi:hypothetical protein